MHKTGFLLFLVLLAGTTLAQEVHPEIRFEQTALQFENALTDSTLKAVFKFDNLGTDSLRILALRPG